MKKILTLCVVALMAISTVSARSYKVALGLATGLEYGPTVKVNFTDHFTLMNDLTWKFVPNTVAGVNGQTFNFGYMGLIDNVNVAYQTKLASGRGLDLLFYGGGGMSIGYADLETAGGKFGVNALAGIEVTANVPIAFTFDFRPGYALLFANGGQIHALDWSLVLAVRYAF
ncbi:MAG: hypothetical protein IJ882_00765 [Paludibacteraceae bacterium]|nr:hypothetical protein [Paludibacteraceae bacterium]